MEVSATKQRVFVLGRWVWKVKISLSFNIPGMVNKFVDNVVTYFKTAVEANKYIIDTLKLASLPQVREYMVSVEL